MRRFVTLVVLLLFAIPFGVSISGCSKTVAPTFCNGGDSGITTGQTTNILVTPLVYGISLNYAEIGQISPPTATNCKGATVFVNGYTYGSTNMQIVDVQPSTGRLCAGTWNRNSGGGIPDFTYCTPTNITGTAYISASANGVTSNPLPVFVHPVVTSIVLGGPSNNCTTDPTTACCPLATVGEVTANPYLPTSCVSQGSTAQLVARVYAGTGANISCQAGHLQFSVLGSTSLTSVSPVVSIDQNGVATAEQPGSVLITANIANAASSAGVFSTCPPASITLSAAGVTGSPVVVNENNQQSLVATAVDTNGVTLNGLSLEYVSTSPSTIQGSATLRPTYAGSAQITALCQPPTCNPAAYNQIGLFGNGKPVASNSVNVTTPGTNSTVLYMASTQSQGLVQVDFTTGVVGSPFQLPLVPNSMVVSNNGLTVYLGSSTALMVLSAINQLSISRTDITSPGTVLALSPDGSTLVISDPIHQVIELENSSGGVLTTYGGVGTHAEFTPDSQTVYITAGDQLLVYSENSGWTSISPATPEGTAVEDVAVTVPSVGAYFAGPRTTARGYCSSSTPTAQTGTENNVFFPLAYDSATVTDRIAATNDGMHILGATVTGGAIFNDLKVSIPSGNANGTATSVACPMVGGLSFSSVPTPTTLAGVTATAITGVLPTADSTEAFVTYTGSGGILPVYAPQTGQMSYVKLSGTATAPISGVMSADNSMLYVGTSGDNLVHLITTKGAPADSSTIAPNLVAAPGQSVPAGTAVPVNLIGQKVRTTT
jgi:hypothetical protein